jgi:hypothetical protein
MTTAVLLVALASGVWRGSIAATDHPSSQHDETTGGRAVERFRNVFHGGQYDDLPAVIEDLTRAATEKPRDPNVNRLLGVAHYWVVAEARRQSAPRLSDADHLILADFYLDRARHLQTEDQQFLGFVEAFQAGAKLWFAEIHHDETLKQDGERLLDQAMGHYPPFAMFTRCAFLHGLTAVASCVDG